MLKAIGMILLSLLLCAAGFYIEPGIVSKISLIAAGGFAWYGMQRLLK